MDRIALIVEYDGTNYCGWQIQKNGISVQQRLCLLYTSTIYNTTPLMLFGYGKELQKADFSNFRLNFTVESERCV